jgi:hypothetical protein
VRDCKIIAYCGLGASLVYFKYAQFCTRRTSGV